MGVRLWIDAHCDLFAGKVWAGDSVLAGEGVVREDEFFYERASAGGKGFLFSEADLSGFQEPTEFQALFGNVPPGVETRLKALRDMRPVSSKKNRRPGVETRPMIYTPNIHRNLR